MKSEATSCRGGSGFRSRPALASADSEGEAGSAASTVVLVVLAAVLLGIVFLLLTSGSAAP